MLIKPKKKFWMTGVAPYYAAAGGAVLGFTPFSVQPAYQDNAFAGSLVTFSGVPIATPGVVVVAVACPDTGYTAAPTVTMNTGGGAVAMSLIVSDIAPTTNRMSMYMLNATSGTAASFAVTFQGGTVGKVGMVGGVLTGVNTSTVPSGANISGAALSGANPFNTTATIPVSGIGISVAFVFNNATTTTVAGPAILDSNTHSSVAINLSLALSHTLSTGSQTVAYTNTPASNAVGVMAGFGP